MLTSDLLASVDDFLRKQVMNHYQVRTIKGGSTGDHRLQTARIVLFDLMRNLDKGDIVERFNDPQFRELFFRSVDEKIDEREKRSRYAPSVKAFMYSIILGKDSDHGLENHLIINSDETDDEPLSPLTSPVLPISCLTLRRILSYHGYMTARILGLPDIMRRLGLAKQEALDAIVQKMGEVEKMLSSPRKRNSEITAIYAQRLAAMFEDIREGRTDGSNSFQQIPLGGRTGLLSDSLNRRILIPYITEKYILQRLDCTLEDLPLQTGLKETLNSLGNIYSGSIPFFRETDMGMPLRTFFVEGYPEMEHSPHWYEARWYGIFRDASPEKKEEYFRFLVRYLFEEKLGCRSREDVLSKLKKPHEVLEEARKQRIPLQSKQPQRKIRHIYYLIEAVKGEAGMYDIEPWELSVIPRGVFRHEDGTPDEDALRKYLLWAEKQFGVPRTSPNFYREDSVPPHFYGILKIIGGMEKVRKLMEDSPKFH